jgi:hypothetical protein
MPEHMPDDEPVVRSVRKGWVKKGVLLYNAYRPSANRTLISVLRGSFGVDWCQAKSMLLTNADYAGIAVHRVQQIRDLGILVVDAPEDFEGHAHIDHIDPPLPPNDPLSPEVNKVLNDRCKELARIADYHPDGFGSPERFQERHLGLAALVALVASPVV